MNSMDCPYCDGTTYYNTRADGNLYVTTSYCSRCLVGFDLISNTWSLCGVWNGSSKEWHRMPIGCLFVACERLE